MYTIALGDFAHFHNCIIQIYIFLDISEVQNSISISPSTAKYV